MDAEGISMEEFKSAFEKGNMFASGIAVDYGSSLIVAKSGNVEDQGDGTDVSVSSKFRIESMQSLAPGIKIGMRMPSTKVLNQSDARPWHFQELLPSNGRWRVVVFTGDISQPEQKSKMETVGKAFNDEASFLRRFTPADARYDTVFEVLAVHSAPRTSATIFDFPEVFRPYDDVDGFDYMKIYVDDVSYHEGHGKIYETFNIDPKGCIVIIRPDQYVSYVGPTDDTEAINCFFSGFMRVSAQKTEIVNGPPGGATSNGLDDAPSHQPGSGAAALDGIAPNEMAAQNGDVLPA
ncbi:hypothetical protein LTR09_001820 [Extremus antarcticus]|uniref:Phenol hydroxylase-like C-terminal dimerisation domain-containing protein n=1 Tax=Extremus antarcticus TaxID=702011 RepID=A0AAJ0GHH0_9PEZI|nr:hypothetical protein LTR09_001820 [Extremus antarcticus]